MPKVGERFDAVFGGIVKRGPEDNEYVYREYPKGITLADGSVVIVDNAEEEAILIGPIEQSEAQPKRRGRPPKHA